jgi:CRISPR-associated protein Csx10
MILNLEVKSPVTISVFHGITNEIYTLDYIPGTVIRGALAEAYIGEYNVADPIKDKNFCSIFLSGESVFGNFYPAGAKLIPDSALTCKYEKGFEGEGHGIIDMIVPLINKDDNLLEYCKSCHASMNNIKGFFEKNGNQYKCFSTPTRLLARTALSAISDTAKKGSLFTMEAINEGQYFTGNITILEAVRDHMNAFLKDGKRLRIGSSRSRGQGECFLSIGKDEVENKTTGKRLVAFNKEINDKEHTYFSVTFMSDVILYDEYLRYKNRIDIEDLLENVEDCPTLKDCFQSSPEISIGGTRIISGWNYAPNIRLPKEDVMAIKKGAVFVFKSKSHLSEAQVSPLIDDLNKLPGHICERTAEGFGAISICYDFHIDFCSGG